jgi:hypothetical protein
MWGTTVTYLVFCCGHTLNILLYNFQNFDVKFTCIFALENVKKLERGLVKLYRDLLISKILTYFISVSGACAHPD